MVLKLYNDGNSFKVIKDLTGMTESYIINTINHFES
jgi:hypothetical protein